MAHDPHILALDLGLTHAKAVVFAPDGRLVDRQSVAYPTHRPAPDRVEQDPVDWWDALTSAVRSIGARSPDALRQVEAMSVTGHMHGLVLEDADRRPIGPAIVLGDHRAADEATHITERLGAAWIARTTGATLDPSMPAAELRWLTDHDPDRMRRVALVTGPKDHLRGRLTGDRLTEPIDACATSLYDIRARRWSPEMVDASHVGRHLLPEVVACQAVAGPLRSDPAAALGVRQGIQVVVGVGDDVEVLGAGMLEPGDALEHLGTTGSILAVTDEPALDPGLALELYPHVLDDRWVVGGSMTTAGAALGWVADILGYHGVADMLAALGPPDRGPLDSVPIFLASMAGERCPVREPAARGAWTGLDTGFDRRALARSAFEGVAFALERILRSIEGLIGPQRHVMVSAGGTDLDPRWLALRASTYQRALVTLATPEPTALGLATVVAAGAGIHPDVASAVRAMARRADETAVAAGTAEALAARRATAERSVAALRPVWPELGRSPVA